MDSKREFVRKDFEVQKKRSAVNGSGRGHFKIRKSESLNRGLSPPQGSNPNPSAAHDHTSVQVIS